MSTALVPVDQNAIATLDQLAEQAGRDNQSLGYFSRAVALADQISAMRGALEAPGVLDRIMALQGSAIGFKTDKDKDGGYQKDTIKDAVIEAVCKGLSAVGNEFNIISGRCYVTKEGLGKMLRRIEGLTYQIVPGVPHMQQGGAIVEMTVTWTMKGKEGKQVLSIPVRVNAGMGADAIVGKATRKARAWLLGYLTGSEMPEGEADDSRAITVPGTSVFEKAPEPAAEPTHAAEPKPFADASAEVVAGEIAKLCEASQITYTAMNTWAAKALKNPKAGWADVPLAMRRVILADPDSWVTSVRELMPK